MDQEADDQSDLNVGVYSPEYRFKGKYSGNPPAGICLGVGEKGKTVKIAHTGFYTDYDGDFFFTCLDNISGSFLQDWISNKRRKFSKIDNCIIFIAKNNEYEVYINFPILLKMVSKKAVAKGDPIYKGDFADIKILSFPTLSFKQNCGIIYIFSMWWRRGLYFNFLPLIQGNNEISETYPTLFAGFHSYLMFPEIYRKDPSVYDRIKSDGWFPFICIIGKQYEKLYTAYQYDVGKGDIIKEIIDSFGPEKIRELENKWYVKKEFENHRKTIEAGIERYLAGDFISAINNLYPRIEGVLRYVHLGKGGSESVKELLNTLQQTAEDHTTPSCLFLPDDFRTYLQESFFSSFDLDTGQIDLSRHSVAHGVADENQYNQIKALQGIFILDQISYYI